jgi:hypothetical protein
VVPSAAANKKQIAIRGNKSNASSARRNVSVLANIFLSHLLRDAERGVA